MGRKRNGVGVIPKVEYANNVVEVKRVLDRVVRVKIESEGVMTNTGYVTQEKEKFWSQLTDMLEMILRMERAVIGANLNGYVCLKERR